MKKTSSLFCIPVLLGLLAAPSCSKEAGASADSGYLFPPRLTQSVPADMGKLIPADALGYFHIQSLTSLTNKFKEIAESVEAGSGDEVDLLSPMTMIGLDPEQVDMDQPLGIALSLDSMGQPSPVLILPIKDPSQFTQPMGEPVFSGKYLGMSPMGGDVVLGTSTPEQMQELPAGDFSARINLASLIEMYGPMAEMFLSPQMLMSLDPNFPQDGPIVGMMESMMEGVRVGMENAQELELSVSLDGGALNMTCGFKVKPGGVLDMGPAKSDVDLMQLARHLNLEDANTYYMLDANWALLSGFMDDLYASMAESFEPEEGKAFLAAATRYQKVLEGAGPMVFTMSMRDGVQMLGAMQHKDPAACVKEMEQMVAAMTAGDLKSLGVECEAVDPITVDGVTLQGYRMNMDQAAMLKKQGLELDEEMAERQKEMMESMFGKDGMQLFYAAVEGELLFVMGDAMKLAPPAIAAIRSGNGELSAGLQQIIPTLHEKPWFFSYTDLRSYTSDMLSLMPKEVAGEVRQVPDGPAIPMWFSLASDGAVHHMDMQMDIKGIVDMASAMQLK